MNESYQQSYVQGKRTPGRGLPDDNPPHGKEGKAGYRSPEPMWKLKFTLKPVS